MFDFEKLLVYNKAKVFHSSISNNVLLKVELRRHEKDQLGRAALSIVLNIAERTSRFTKASKRNYFVIARGSVFECIALLDILKDKNIITEKLYLDYYHQCNELSRILFKMI